MHTPIVMYPPYWPITLGQGGSRPLHVYAYSKICGEMEAVRWGQFARQTYGVDWSYVQKMYDIMEEFPSRYVQKVYGRKRFDKIRHRKYMGR